MKRLIALALASALLALPASAQNFPDKPIHIIVPFTPGSATDVVARAAGGGHDQEPGPDGHRREQAGRRRHDRRRPGRQGRPRRLHAARQLLGAHGQSGDLSQHDLRHGEGPAGRQPARRAAQHHGRLAVEGLEDRGRLREGGEGGAGQAHLRHRRHRQRHAHERREVQARGRHRHGARALQGHARGAGRHHERPHRHLFLPDDRRPADDQATAASWRWPTAAPSAPRCCPTCRPRRSRASRTAATISGSACSRRPARRRR